LVQTPVQQNAKHFGRRRRSAGLVIKLQSDSNPSRLFQHQTNPEPTARFFSALPEDRFKPLFDKIRSILDATGGPQDLLSNFSLIAIHPDYSSTKPTPNQRHVFLFGPPRELVQTPLRSNAKVFWQPLISKTYRNLLH
jgi:hypothetical protein